MLVTKLAWLFILLWGKMGRIDLRNRRYLTWLKRNNKRYIYVAWHGRMLLPIYVHRNKKIVAMVSEHSDGEMIAKTIERIGYETVRGSSTRGGSKAFRQLLRALKTNGVGTILPDGPNGPRYKFKMGAVLLAQLSGAYLLPVTYSAQKPITLKSWDRFTLWWPLSKLYVIYGEPMKIPRKSSSEELERYRQAIEDRMNLLQKEADAIFQQ